MRKHSARFVAGVVVAGALVFVGQPAFAQYGHVPVEVCHKPGSPAEKSLTVDESAVPGHLGHGDYLGECVTAPSPSPEPDPSPEPEPEEPEQPAEPEQPEEPVEVPEVPEVPAEPEAPTEPAVPLTPDTTPASSDTRPVTLAETGANTHTPWIAGVALALVTAGFLALRRARIKGMTE